MVGKWFKIIVAEGVAVGNEKKKKKKTIAAGVAVGKEKNKQISRWVK